MRILRIKFIVIVFLLISCINSVIAEENEYPKLLFSGFGTFGLVHSSEDKAEFTKSVFTPNGAGATRSWSMDVDTKIAGQVTALLTPKLSVVIQAIAEHRYNNTYKPELEWANIKYDFTPDFYIRLGRVVLPDFLVSDYRKVGYINPWVRPPQELYSLIPITKNDGIDASYRFRIGEVTNTIQATYGGLDTKLPDSTEAQASKQWNISNKIEYGSFSLNLSYYQSRFTLEQTLTLFNSFTSFGTQGLAIEEEYNCKDRTIRAGSIGFSYDPGDWFIMGEIARRVTDCFVDNNTGGYVTAGYRYKKFTPYITYAQVNADGVSESGLNTALLPPAFVTSANTLNTALSDLLESSPIQKTFSVGLRWDFMKNTALKLQYDHSHIGINSPGTLFKTQSGFQSDSSYNVFSATIDFVF